MNNKFSNVFFRHNLNMCQELFYHQNCNWRHEDLMVPLASRGGNFCDFDTWMPRCVIVTTLQWLEWVHYELNTIQRENQNYSINMNRSLKIKEQVVKMIGIWGCVIQNIRRIPGVLIQRLDCFVKLLIPIMQMLCCNVLIFPLHNMTFIWQHLL